LDVNSAAITQITGFTPRTRPVASLNPWVNPWGQSRFIRQLSEIAQQFYSDPIFKETVLHQQKWGQSRINRQLAKVAQQFDSDPTGCATLGQAPT
jgi:hypothetical protein